MSLQAPELSAVTPPIARGGDQGSKRFHPVPRATRLVSSRAGPLPTLGGMGKPWSTASLWVERGSKQLGFQSRPCLMGPTGQLGKAGFLQCPEAASPVNHHSRALRPPRGGPQRRGGVGGAHLHAMVALPGIGHEQHDLPLRQLPRWLPIGAAPEPLCLRLGVVPGPGSAVPATVRRLVLLLPGAPGSGALRVPGHGGPTGKAKTA